MKKKVNYKKVYCDFFGYSMFPDEFIPSEISKDRSIDIHHIYPKGMGGRKTFIHDGTTYDIDCIENLIAVTRLEHYEAHEESNPCHKYKNDLWNIHQAKMHAHLNVGKSRINAK